MRQDAVDFIGQRITCPDSDDGMIEGLYGKLVAALGKIEIQIDFILQIIAHLRR